VLKKGVSRKNAIVWLYYSGGYLWGWVYAESKLGFAAVVYGKTLKKKGSKTGSGTSSYSVKAEESLKASAVVSKLADAVKYKVYDFLANGVVTTSVVVSSIFLSGDDLLRVVKRAVGTGTYFITYSWLKINKNSTWNVFACSGFREKGVESIIAASDGFVAWHLSVRLDAVL